MQNIIPKKLNENYAKWCRNSTRTEYEESVRWSAYATNKLIMFTYVEKIEQSVEAIIAVRSRNTYAWERYIKDNEDSIYVLLPCLAISQINEKSTGCFHHCLLRVLSFVLVFQYEIWNHTYILLPHICSCIKTFSTHTHTSSVRNGMR